ncbi:MAG: MBL fold metallo-hydrolase [Candidatus Methanomethylophilaceae archaeon]|nr:MBL fold metallo-hydrolase [Candidatus Methanomethylophilaceae archaeon]
MREVECLTVRGVFATNCYIVSDGSGRCIVADPGFEGERIAERLQSEGLLCEYIILTHGHFDHICGIPEIKDVFGCPVLACRGSPYLTDTRLNLSAGFGIDATVPDPVWIDEGPLPGEWAGIEAVRTPGHTPDSMTFYDREGGFALVGDTIFRGSVGNWQYPGGNRNELFRSITDRIFTLPDDTVLLSGHTEPTTVGEEKRRYGLL